MMFRSSAVRSGGTVSPLFTSLVCCLSLFAALLYSAGPAAAKPGDLDATFGQGGKVVTQFDGGMFPTAVAEAVVALPDGDLVVAGSAGELDDPDFALARYNSNGSLD